MRKDLGTHQLNPVPPRVLHELLPEAARDGPYAALAYNSGHMRHEPVLELGGSLFISSAHPANISTHLAGLCPFLTHSTPSDINGPTTLTSNSL